MCNNKLFLMKRVTFWQGRQCSYNATLWCFRVILLLQRSNKNYMFRKCVYKYLALFIQHVMCMRHILLSSVACRAVLYFSTLSYKQHNFRKKLLNTKNVLFDFLYKSVWHRITLASHPNPPVEPMLHPTHNRRLKRRWTFDQNDWGGTAGC